MGNTDPIDIAALVAAMKRELIADATIARVLAAAGLGAAEAAAWAEGREAEPSPPPESQTALNDALMAAEKAEDWPRVAALIERLLGLEGDPARAAHYHYTLAVVREDKLGDRQGALEALDAALDGAPTHPRAFARIERMLTAAGDWKALERSYRKMLLRAVNASLPARRQFELWRALGAIYAERLEQADHAALAWERALALEADPDLQRRFDALARE
jgi:tetratricopeptide (TPR) repeat protein